MGPAIPRVCAAGGHGQRPSDQERRGRAAGEGEWWLRCRTASSHRVLFPQPLAAIHPSPLRSTLFPSWRRAPRRESTWSWPSLPWQSETPQQFATRGAIVLFMRYANGVLELFRPVESSLTRQYLNQWDLPVFERYISCSICLLQKVTQFNTAEIKTIYFAARPA